MKLEREKLNELYWKSGLSIPDVAKELRVPKSNVEYWMKKFEIPRRPLLRYPRAHFTGNMGEKSYMLGLRYGDLYVARYKKAIVISTTTTHPAMAETFWLTFRKYGRIYMHPFLNQSENRYQWVLRVIVHDSFSFLLDKPLHPPKWALTKETIPHFVAGFFDAEGSIIVTTRIRNSRWKVIEISLRICNTRKTLLRAVASRMSYYHPAIELVHRKGPDASAYGAARKRNVWRIIVRRRMELKRLLEKLPIRHPEKAMKLRIALMAMSGQPYADVRSSVAQLQSRIRREVDAFAKLAEVRCRVDDEIASMLS
ncbi:MAG: hypothetical protein OK449_00035 [Thaumarchaeota archaeon]|nr:hypothetical protein [Nitrososphaerota archaeon]